MRFIVFGDEDETACLFVKAVHDAGAQIASNRRKLIEVMEQRVDQCALVPARIPWLRPPHAPSCRQAY